MLKPFLLAMPMLTIFSVVGATTHSQPASSDTTLAPLEEVIVTGEWAGPKLWKISRGEHTVWVLGTPDTLPKNMTWRSKEVDAVMSEVQVVIANSTSVDVSAGPIAAVRLYFQWRRVRDNDHGKTLKEALPPALYARFSALKTKYAPRDTALEARRPMVAAGRLYRDALEAAGLLLGNTVERTVLQLADKHRVKVQRASLKIEDPKAVLKELGDTPRQSELDCLESTMTRLETDIEPMRRRARAWALGDVAQLRELPYQDNFEVCLQALSDSARIRELRTRAETLWLSAVEGALGAHQSSLALYPIARLIGSGSVLEKFRLKGYAVAGP